ARAHRPDIRADLLDDPDELVPHAAAGLRRLHRLVRPQVAAADRGAADPHERVGRFDEVGVRDVLDSNVAGPVHDRCAHPPLPPPTGTVAVSAYRSSHDIADAYATGLHDAAVHAERKRLREAVAPVAAEDAERVEIDGSGFRVPRRGDTAADVTRHR